MCSTLGAVLIMEAIMVYEHLDHYGSHVMIGEI